jgi:phosphatidylserine/phosphatidylglycerophosphate/cardiolipin synthase-like enzyme
VTLLSSSLLSTIYEVVRFLPRSAVEHCITILLLDLSDAEIQNRLLASTALSEPRASLRLLIEAWREDATPPKTIAIALQAALYTQSTHLAQTQTELVWTGPRHGVALRRTDQALQQVIQLAKKELLIITFAAYHIPHIAEALSEAIARGVTVRIVAESPEESDGKVTTDIRQSFARFTNNIQIYVWPQSKRERDDKGNFGALHAKCALADDTHLFISSANLTNHALLLNMEMGILLSQGSLPKQVHQHFQDLISQGDLIPID